MGLIDPQLEHRVIVHRQTVTDDDGSPVKTWSAVSTPVPVRFSPSSLDYDPDWSPAQTNAAITSGTLTCRPDADIKPNDRLVFSRPAGMGTLLVTTSAQRVPGPGGYSHKEFAVVWLP